MSLNRLFADVEEVIKNINYLRDSPKQPGTPAMLSQQIKRLKGLENKILTYGKRGSVWKVKVMKHNPVTLYYPETVHETEISELVKRDLNLSEDYLLEITRLDYGKKYENT